MIPAPSATATRMRASISACRLVADQVGACAAALKPLHLLIEAHVLAAGRLHGDDTTVPVLAKVRTDIGRIWTYVRDDRPFGGPAPPAAIFHYSRDRRGEHPVQHLGGWAGVLEADAYAGYNALFKPDRPQSRLPARYVGHTRGGTSSCSPTSPPMPSDASISHPSYRQSRSKRYRGSTASSTPSVRSPASRLRSDWRFASV
jgi:hypothetical protein